MGISKNVCLKFRDPNELSFKQTNSGLVPNDAAEGLNSAVLQNPRDQRSFFGGKPDVALACDYRVEGDCSPVTFLRQSHARMCGSVEACLPRKLPASTCMDASMILQGQLPP